MLNLSQLKTIAIYIIAYSVLVFLIRPELGDLKIYKASYELFSSNVNPYSNTEWQAYWQIKEQVPAMVWNPPYFFILFTPVYLLVSLSNFLIIPLSFFLFYDLIIRSARLANEKYKISDIHLFSLPACSVPLLVCCAIGQISVILCWLMIYCIQKYKEKCDISCGICLSLLLLKPHNNFLVIIALVFWSLKERRYLVPLSLLGSLAFLSLTIEFIRPGIHHQWLFRESWPSDFMGAGFATIIRQLIIHNFNRDLSYLGFFIAAMSIAILILFNHKLKNLDFLEKVSLLMLLSSILAPYGFIVDQISILCPFIFLLASSDQRDIKYQQTLYYAPIFISLITIISGCISFKYNIILWLQVPSLLSLIFWLLFLKLGRKYSISR